MFRSNELLPDRADRYQLARYLPEAEADVVWAETGAESAGRHSTIASKAGHGPKRYVSILDNHFYVGHGLSIGSETNAGVSDILVRDVILDGATFGLCIKSDASRGGPATRVRCEGVCLRGNRRPIDLGWQIKNAEVSAGSGGVSPAPTPTKLDLAPATGATTNCAARWIPFPVEN